MGEILKSKYILLIAILSIAIIVAIGIVRIVFFYGSNMNDVYENNEEQNNEIQNIIDKEEKKEENIIKAVIDNEEPEETEKNNNETNNNQNNENKTVANNNPSNEGGNMQNQESTSKYYIKINNEMNVVTVYKKDKSGEYTLPIKAMICSTGDATPTGGVYKISKRYIWRALQGNVYGQYAVRITGNILFHSVPYTAERKDALEWWEYDKLGTKASLGCIRLKVEDAKWIYDNCENGTQVEFYYDSNPGPLGKPTAKKISSYSEDLKNWDPTDPDENNPWKKYKEPVAETEPEEVTQPEDVPVVTSPEETTIIPEQTPSDSPGEPEESTEQAEPIELEQQEKDETETIA